MSIFLKRQANASFFYNFPFQTAEMGHRYEKLGQTTKLITPRQDINAFVKTLNIPDSLTLSKHVFSPPQPTDPAQVSVFKAH